MAKFLLTRYIKERTVLTLRSACCRSQCKNILIEIYWCASSYCMLVFLLSLSCGICQLLLQSFYGLLGSAMGQYQFSSKQIVCLLQVLQSVEYRCDITSASTPRSILEYEV